MNMVEEILGLIVEGNVMYTIRNLDLSINELRENGKNTMKASLQGKSPICLFGKVEDGKKSYIGMVTRDGMGLIVAKNSGQYPIVTKKDVIFI